MLAVAILTVNAVNKRWLCSTGEHHVWGYTRILRSCAGWLRGMCTNPLLISLSWSHRVWVMSYVRDLFMRQYIITRTCCVLVRWICSLCVYARFTVYCVLKHIVYGVCVWAPLILSGHCALACVWHKCAFQRVFVRVVWVHVAFPPCVEEEWGQSSEATSDEWCQRCFSTSLSVGLPAH